MDLRVQRTIGSRTSWIVTFFLMGAVVLWAALQARWLGLHKAFSIDEFQYAHAAWLVSHGQVPYRDFFEVHFPLVYLLLSPVFWWAGDDPLAILKLRAIMVGFALIGAVAAARLNREVSRLAAVATALFVLLSPSLISFLIEIRPDSLGAVLLVVALALLRLRRRPFLAGVGAGLAAVGCAFSTQKAAFYGVVLLIPVAANVFELRRGEALVKRRCLGTVAGALAGTTAVALYLFLSGAAPAFWQWCFVWAAEHERHYSDFPATKYLAGVVQRDVPLLLFAAVGLGGTLRDLASARIRAVLHEDFPLVAAALSTFASIVLQRAPFPYSFAGFLIILAVFGGRGVGILGRSLWAQGRTARTGVVLGAIAGLIWMGAALSQATSRSNGDQLKVLAQVARLTGPDMPVYDNSGGYVARPHVRYLFYTDALLRRTHAAELTRDVPSELIRSGCVVHLRDLRFDGLPPALKAFLSAHYQPYDGDLFLWGMRIPLHEGTGDLEFIAPRAGRYFVSDEGNPAHANLTVDGAPADPRGFELPAGTHSIHYEGGSGEAYVLWLPRNGETWRPHRGAPRFSLLFGHAT
ncbi:MAG: hypothetical protein IRZ16_08415 [Myxococcaceae bacterium]|nr:hypothetical protein [Myxococcaceae bacterium]